MIVGHGRAGKTALAKNLTGVGFQILHQLLARNSLMLSSITEWQIHISGISNDDFSHEDHLPENFKLSSNEINHDKVIHYKELFEMEMASANSNRL